VSTTAADGPTDWSERAGRRVLATGWLLYPKHSHGTEGMAWDRLAVLATAGLATGLLAWRRMGRRIDPWAVRSA